MNSEVEKEVLLISSQNKIPLLSHIKTDFSQLWSLSLVRLNLSESNLFPLKSIAALGFLDISFSKISLEALISSISQIQILEFHYFDVFETFEEEITRGFLIHCLSDIWSFNGSVFNCIEKSHWTKYFDFGAGQFSEIYRKHFVHHLEFSSNEPLIWSNRAKALFKAVGPQFTMVLEFLLMKGI